LRVGITGNTTLLALAAQDKATISRADFTPAIEQQIHRASFTHEVKQHNDS
jgi:hypothetical protein